MFPVVPCLVLCIASAAWIFCENSDVFCVQTTEKAIIRKEKHLQNEGSGDDEEEIYKIEVPANRWSIVYHFET